MPRFSVRIRGRGRDLHPEDLVLLSPSSRAAGITLTESLFEGEPPGGWHVLARVDAATAAEARTRVVEAIPGAYEVEEAFPDDSPD